MSELVDCRAGGVDVQMAMFCGIGDVRTVHNRIKHHLNTKVRIVTTWGPSNGFELVLSD